MSGIESIAAEGVAGPSLSKTGQVFKQRHTWHPPGIKREPPQ